MSSSAAVGQVKIDGKIKYAGMAKLAYAIDLGGVTTVELSAVRIGKLTLTFCFGYGIIILLGLLDKLA